MRNIHQFLRLIDLRTISVTILAVISTYACKRFNLVADMPSGLIGIAIIFPIVFSINAAYRRREEALKYYASLKAHAVSLFYAHRDWVPVGDDGPDDAQRMRSLIDRLLTSIMGYFLTKDNIKNQELEDVYSVFSEISQSHEILRDKKIPANEISRANQYLRAMIIEFERMKNILFYRTPISIRSYSFVFLNSFPILYGPYFAHLSSKYYEALGYMIAVLYSLVLVSLDNIQEDLEDPFDSYGPDDMHMDVIDEYMKILN
ncbi:hypothetical protein ACFL27_02095 [candidate division CSSED10-310 bacterium]|uniref:Bestrophin n=1 Tax=candidate division CSSED10-310 bacterium TaxID=2855610 RepID=A0ABV6YS63_UNCC1